MSYKITFTRGKVDEVVTVARPGAMAVFSDVQSLNLPSRDEFLMNIALLSAPLIFSAFETRN